MYTTYIYTRLIPIVEVTANVAAPPPLVFSPTGTHAGGCSAFLAASDSAEIRVSGTSVSTNGVRGRARAPLITSITYK